jgi:hypothetical protein
MLQTYFGDLASILDPGVWGNESFNLGIKYAYANLTNGSTLDDQYIKASRIIVRYIPF